MKIFIAFLLVLFTSLLIGCPSESEYLKDKYREKIAKLNIVYFLHEKSGLCFERSIDGLWYIAHINCKNAEKQTIDKIDMFNNMRLYVAMQKLLLFFSDNQHRCYAVLNTNLPPYLTTRVPCTKEVVDLLISF